MSLPAVLDGPGGVPGGGGDPVLVVPGSEKGIHTCMEMKLSMYTYMFLIFNTSLFNAPS